MVQMLRNKDNAPFLSFCLEADLGAGFGTGFEATRRTEMHKSFTNLLGVTFASRRHAKVRSNCPTTYNKK